MLYTQRGCRLQTAYEQKSMCVYMYVSVCRLVKTMKNKKTILTLSSMRTRPQRPQGPLCRDRTTRTRRAADTPARLGPLRSPLRGPRARALRRRARRAARRLRARLLTRARLAQLLSLVLVAHGNPG